CGKSKGLTLEGSLSIKAVNASTPLAGYAVALLHDSLATKELAQRREGFQMELAAVQARRILMIAMMDSLQAKYIDGGRKDDSVKKAYEDMSAQMAGEYKKELEFKKTYIRSLVQSVARDAVAGTKTDAKGLFKFENLTEGKYMLISAYDSDTQSGLILRPLNLNANFELALSNMDFDPTFTITAEDYKALRQ
ncbi:MAG: carboxypeptidase regulatory-like domain-containing protein, partial [Rhizobacter sp.]|nr:carboxypeptidase regulatory-like domain-containing protein [Chlorobiales bacterium]